MATSTSEDQLTWHKVGENSRMSADAKPPTQPPIKCPECGSSRVWKDGLRYIRSETGEIVVQRYICRECGRRFSEDISYLQSNRHIFNRCSGLSTCQVSVSEREMKNLSHQRTRIKKRAAGATKLSEEDIAGKIVEYLWHLKKQGYAKGTIENRTRLLKQLVKLGSNLYDPEDVKKVIASQETWGEGQKRNVTYAYQTFIEMEAMTWQPPKYRQPESLPFVPLEAEIDALISGCGRKVSTFLHGLKEIGADPGELWRVEWVDMNTKTKTVNIKYPVRRHNPRILPISQWFVDRLQLLPKKAERIFPMTLSCLRTNYWEQRRKLARKLQNPRLLKATFTSIRHWKATTEYHKTRDILHVKQLLGHKSLTSTMIYIDIERAIYGEHGNDEFITRAATSVKGIRALLEMGFEKADEIDGVHIYRKRK